MKSTKFHINSKGKPSACDASMRLCPLGGAHYDSKQAAAQAIMEAELGITTPTVPTAVIPEASDSWGRGQIRVRELPAGFKVAPDKAVLPAGTYFLGDPCYTAGLDDDSWQRWIEAAANSSAGFTEPIVGGSYNGYPVIASCTAYGDGTYWGNNGEEYSVDAGLIGVVPEAVIQGMDLTPAQLGPYGTWVTVDHSASLEYDEDGTITFGPLTIQTGDDEEDEQEEENFCEQCGRHLDGPWDSLCEDCGHDSEHEDDED